MFLIIELILLAYSEMNSWKRNQPKLAVTGHSPNALYEIRNTRNEIYNFNSAWWGHIIEKINIFKLPFLYWISQKGTIYFNSLFLLPILSRLMAENFREKA
jgi:hypothetical protein